MGPVRQNPIQRTVSLFICVCIALCTIVAHNTAQNGPDNFPPCPPDNQTEVQSVAKSTNHQRAGIRRLPVNDVFTLFCHIHQFGFMLQHHNQVTENNVKCFHRQWSTEAFIATVTATANSRNIKRRHKSNLTSGQSNLT